MHFIYYQQVTIYCILFIINYLPRATSTYIILVYLLGPIELLAAAFDRNVDIRTPRLIGPARESGVGETGYFFNPGFFTAYQRAFFFIREIPFA